MFIKNMLQFSFQQLLSLINNFAFSTEQKLEAEKELECCGVDLKCSSEMR